MALVLVSMITALASAGQQDAFTPARVAVVNVPAVSVRYQRTGDLEAEFKQRQVKFDELRSRIGRTQQSLREELKPGTAEFNERRKQLALMETELQWLAETEGPKIEAGLANSLQSIFNDIQMTVAEVAQERGIDVVLSTEPFSKEVIPNPMQVRQRIALQKVLYFHPRLDLTDEVITRLNARYMASKNAPP